MHTICVGVYIYMCAVIDVHIHVYVYIHTCVCSTFWIRSDSTQRDNRHLDITSFHLDAYQQLKRSKARWNRLCHFVHDTWHRVLDGFRWTLSMTNRGSLSTSVRRMHCGHCGAATPEIALQSCLLCQDWAVCNWVCSVHCRCFGYQCYHSEPFWTLEKCMKRPPCGETFARPARGQAFNGCSKHS